MSGLNACDWRRCHLCQRSIPCIFNRGGDCDMHPGQLLSEHTGWWICCLTVFVISTSGWDLIGMVAHLQTVQMDALFLSCMCKCVHQSTYTAARLTLARFGRGEGEHGGQNESSIEANTSTALENNCQHTFCLLSFNLIIGCKGWLSCLGQSTTFLTLEGETHLIL